LCAVESGRVGKGVRRGWNEKCWHAKRFSLLVFVHAFKSMRKVDSKREGKTGTGSKTPESSGFGHRLEA